MVTEGITLKDSKADDSVKKIKENTTFVIDLTGTICTMTNLLNTYKEFVWNFVSTLPRVFKRLDIVPDTYREKSIKGGERSTCGPSQKFIIASCKSRLPCDFSVIMKNEKNKTWLIEIVSEVLRGNFAKVLTSLRCSTMFISQEDVTYCLTESVCCYSQGETILKL